jgi:hypothetical protein
LHACANKSTGWFVLRRHTSKKRMRAKLSEVKTELHRRQHYPVPSKVLACQRHRLSWERMHRIVASVTA